MIRKISFYAILKILNIIAFFGLFLVFNTYGTTTYVNLTTIILASLLCILNILILNDSQRNENSFLLVLSFWILFFYIGRVLSLNYTDYSVVLRRFDATPFEINKTLGYGIICILACWIGLHFKNVQKNKIYKYCLNISPNIISKSLYLYWGALFFEIISRLSIPAISSFAKICNNFILKPQYVLLIISIIIIKNWTKIEKKYRVYYLASVGSFVLELTMGGSRAGLYFIAKMIFYICLALQITRVNIKPLFIGLMCLPLMIFMFTYSTYMRQMDARNVSLSEKITMINEVATYSQTLPIDKLLAPVFDRIGFLDYTCEMYSNSKSLSKIVNVEQELKSIVDNALSPGFDVFDAPRVGTVITNFYEYGPIKSKRLSTSLDYHSDELTLFGESYLLFGIPLCFVFLLSLVSYIKKILLKPRNTIEEDLILHVFSLYLFEVLLSSFGFDWLILEIVCIFMTYKIYFSFVVPKRARLNEKITNY